MNENKFEMLDTDGKGELNKQDVERELDRMDHNDSIGSERRGTILASALQ